MKAAAEKGSQGYMSYYADDSVEVPNGARLIQGKVEIAKGMGFLDDKNNRLIWTPVGADISRPAISATPTATTSSIARIKTASRLSIRQVHQHLEEAEGWKLEGCARHGERQSGTEVAAISGSDC